MNKFNPFHPIGQLKDSRSRRAASLCLCFSLLLGICGVSRADEPPSVVSGNRVFGLPSSSLLSSFVEYEKFSTEGENEGGRRYTGVFGYTFSLGSQRGLSIAVPYQSYYKIDQGRENGFGDVRLTLRQRKLFGNAVESSSALDYGVIVGLPTGAADKGIDTGKFGVGLTANYLRRAKEGHVAYIGASIYDIPNRNTIEALPTAAAMNVYVGYNRVVSNRVRLLGELEYVRSLDDENGFRVTVGPAYLVSRSFSLQFNYRKDFQLTGKPEAYTLGVVQRY